MQRRLRRLIPVMAAVVVAIGSGWARSESAGPTTTRSEPATQASGATASADALTMNAMLGFINAEPVFVADMLRPIDEDLREMARLSKTEADFREAARSRVEYQLNTYVSDILIMTNAKSTLTSDDKQRIDMIMNIRKSQLISSHGGSEALANQALKAEGSSVDRAMRDARRRETVDIFLKKTLVPKIVITRDMVLNEYQKTPKKWEQAAELNLYTLTLPVSRKLPREGGLVNGQPGPAIANPTPEQVKQAMADTMAAAKTAIARLKKGEDFATVVQDYDSHDVAASKGGLWGHMTKGSLANKKMEDYAFSMPANTLGEEPLLVNGEDWKIATVVIIKVGDKKEARTISFSEAQKSIEDELYRRQYSKLYKEYEAKLYKAAAIEGVDRMGEVALDVAVARYAKH